MRKTTKNKIITFGLCFMLATTIVASTGLSILASGKGDKVNVQSYKGIIHGKRANTQLDTAFRDTADKYVPFRVRLNESTEPSNNKPTVTRFWLESAKGDNLSDTVDVTLGAGYYLQNTYKSACKTRVYLTAENNNYNANVYKISGKWREE